jgi:hypothetical protein
MARTLWAALAVLGLAADGGVAQTNARWYMGTYGSEILVWDEATETLVDRFPTKHPIPRNLLLSHGRTRLYVTDATAERVEVVDLARRETVDEFSLSEGNVQVRISSLEVDPTEQHAVLFVKRTTKLPDRYVVEGPWMLRYDLAAKRVTDTIPWPDGEQRETANFRYSPDGRLLYLFTDDVIAIDATTFAEVDRWEISEPLEPGLGSLGLPFQPSPYTEEGVYVGLFRVTDPAQNRRMMGIATVHLAEKRVDFFTLGPNQPVSFALAPGGRKGYGLYSEIGRYEFWEFDLEGRRVARRVAFSGRPRMSLRPSADGTRVFVYNAGNTIAVHDAATFELLRTVEFDADIVSEVIVPTETRPGS